MDEALTIEELAESAGLTRRAVRFYVQQKLLPAPLGVGRGKHYDQTHRERLRRIQELQRAGYSLDAIRRVLNGDEVPTPPKGRRVRPRPTIAAELWTRLKVADGCELHLDLKRFNVDVAQLVAAREVLREVLGLNRDADANVEETDEPKTN